MTQLSRHYGVVAIALIAATPAIAGPLEDAATAFRKGDCASALDTWRPLAEQGEAAAQTGLGILYENGCGVPKDGAQALVLYRKAAEQGNPEGEYRLGQAYVQGSKDLPRDRARGLALMVRAGEHGHAISLRSIGDFYRNGLFGFPKDDVQAFTWYQKAADLGSDIAESHLANAYQLGRGVPKDLAQAEFWHRRSEEHTRKKAEDGDVVAQLALGRGYEWGLGDLGLVLFPWTRGWPSFGIEKLPNKTAL
jgi:uncharacterized protein